MDAGELRHSGDRVGTALAGTPTNQFGEEIYREGLEVTIREAANIAGIPVLVTENGLVTEDDVQRVNYLRTAVRGVASCMAEGIDVRGYIAWTGFNNLEWIFGYHPKFGLIAVHGRTQVRTPRPSARRLGGTARASGPRSPLGAPLAGTGPTGNRAS